MGTRVQGKKSLTFVEKSLMSSRNPLLLVQIVFFLNFILVKNPCSSPKAAPFFVSTSGKVQHRKSTIYGLPVTLRMLRVKSDNTKRLLCARSENWTFPEVVLMLTKKSTASGEENEDTTLSQGSLLSCAGNRAPGKVQRYSGFEWLCKHNRLRPEPIRFVRLDSEHAQSDGKSVNRGLLELDLARACDPRR